MIFLAEKTGAELAISGDADARTEAAEGLRNGGDEADFAGGTVGKAVFARGFAALVGNLDEWPARMDAFVDFRGRDDEFAGPVAVSVEGHKFDEAHDDAAFAGKGRESFDFIVVEAAHEHSVHFGRRKAGVLNGVDAIHDLAEGFRAGNAFEFGGIERVE